MKFSSYLDLNSEAITGLLQQEKKIEKAASILSKCVNRSGLIITAGNGGSASTASHLVCDLAKGVSIESGKSVRAISLNDNLPLLTAWSNDFSYDVALSKQLEIIGKEGDVLVIISGSGKSRNIICVLESARAQGISTIAILGNTDGDALDLADIAIVVDSKDMQIIENVQLLICHWFFKALPLLLS